MIRHFLICAGPKYATGSCVNFGNIFKVEVANMCIDSKFVFLMGDSNARVCNKDDFVDADDFLTHHLSLDDTMDGSLNISSKLERTNLSKHRVSQDKIINNEGNMLLYMCKSKSRLILNGRCGDYKFNGSVTFRNQSVIDYSIVSFQSLQFIKSFRVLELDALFSDGHSLISTSLCFKNDLKVKKGVPINTKAQKPRLHKEKRTHFIENLNHLKQSLLANITQTSETTDLLSKEKVNTLCNKFSEILNESNNSCNNHNKGSNTANNNKKHGSDTDVLSQVNISPRKEKAC